MTVIKDRVVEDKLPAPEYRVQHGRSIALVGRCWEQRAEQRLAVGAMHGSQGSRLGVGGTTSDSPVSVPSHTAPRA